ncbi:MAG: hypothetical protein IJ175_06100 [Clostridia bacterium]|nr:hypothetical protein [Clostridia bacterium]
MKNAEAGLTYSNLLPFILAVLLIFLIPMLMRRYGLEWSDITRMLFGRLGKRDYAEAAKQKKREPWQRNGRSQDLSGLVSTLMIFARRTKAGLVYPGTVQHGGRMANLVAFVVTKKEVIGINCFGFGGTITEQEGKWNQHMNGEDREIPDPVAGNAAQHAIARAVMDESGMKDVPLRVVAVFTSHTVSVRTAHEGEVFDTRGLLEHLQHCMAGPEENLDPAAVSRQLNGYVVRIQRKK